MSERVTSGLGKVAGKAKGLAGSLTDREELAREGRLQQAQADAQAEASRHAAEASQRSEPAVLEQQARQADAEARAVDPKENR